MNSRRLNRWGPLRSAQAPKAGLKLWLFGLPLYTIYWMGAVCAR
jgi:hypothetical protein